MSIQTVARFVTRDGGGEAEDGLLIGGLLRAGRAFFKPGYVYEIQEVLGELLIKEIGPSWIKPTCKSGRTLQDEEGKPREVQNACCWNNEIGSVLSIAGKCVVLSEAEYIELCNSDEKP